MGIVTDQENRRVSLIFPAAGEQRVYAIDNAPLTRVHYPVGEKVSDADGVTITIEQLDIEDGRIIYVGPNSDGRQTRIDEMELDSAAQFSKPQERLFAGQIDSNSHFELRVDTLVQPNPDGGLGYSTLTVVEVPLGLTVPAGSQIDVDELGAPNQGRVWGYLADA